VSTAFSGVKGSVLRTLFVVALCLVAGGPVFGQAIAPRFGGLYADLDARRQALVNDWVERFTKVTGQQLPAGPFYDEIMTLSTKTTFDAVTHALMTTNLTSDSGAAIGDGLELIERLESVRGEVVGASGDRQFRVYARLTPGAFDRLEQSREFKRGIDNTVYHQGYPINFRAQGGSPSIQISIAPDRRRADIDVDYRASFFPVGLFNGHLTAANSDVRAGNNTDRHAAKWAGLQSWWRGFFGIRANRPPVDTRPGLLAIAKPPRAGKKNIDVMVNDFLTAWLIEGDALAAIGYVSERAYACVGQDADDPSNFDRGLAPFELLTDLKATHEALGKQQSLDGLVVGVRPAVQGLKVVTYPHHARVVLTAVPDDVAAAFDCESRLTLGDDRRPPRGYGNYFGATFFIKGSQDQRMSLLWGRENGYWKIVSWSTGGDEDTVPPAPVEAITPVPRIAEDPALSKAARTFLDAWLVRRDYRTAFAFLSSKSYACYDLERDPAQPAATSPADAGERIRAGLARVGDAVGKRRNLDAIVAPAEPFHPAVRVMNHRDAGTFTLTSLPNWLGDLAECDARVRGDKVPAALPAEYGEAFSMDVRFRTLGGEAPILRLLWRKAGGDWAVTAYGIETP
jgi:hypothetical protein